jgi:hypothetical protein
MIKQTTVRDRARELVGKGIAISTGSVTTISTE